MASQVPESSPDPPPSTDDAKPEDEPSLYCPRCSARLAPHGCKLVCARCGYFMSCAEYH